MTTPNGGGQMETMATTFHASVRAVGTAMTMAAAGFYLHRRKFIAAGEKKALARMSQQVTVPALFFTKIIDCNNNRTTTQSSSAVVGGSSGDCPSFTDNLADVWYLLFWPLYVVGCGLLLGEMAARLSGTPRQQRPVVLAACAFANSTGLPITLLTVIHSNFSETSEIGRNDPTIFLSVYLILYPVLQWAVGGWLLSPVENDTVDSELVVLSTKDSDVEKVDERTEAVDDVHGHSLLSDRIDTHRRHKIETEPQLSRPMVATERETPVTNPFSSKDSATALTDSIVKSLPKACQPPVIAALMGLFITAFVPLRSLFVVLNDQGDNAPLAFLFDGLSLMGKAAIPINMVILGINLSISSRLKPTVSAISIRTTAAIVASKMIVMPCIGILSALLLKNFIWNIPDAIDGPFYLVLMIVTITPTANTIMVLVELSDSDAKEGMSRVLFWEYVFAPIFLTINVMAVVHMAGLW